MIRFKVMKGSHILLAISIIVLAAVLLIILCSRPNGSAEPMNQAASSAMATIADDAALHIEIIPDETAVPVISNAKTILIYHTHTHEAYKQDENDPYEAIETWRTKDQEHSVVRVGAVLAEELRKKGYSVTHDTTDHEKNDIDSAYLNSLETLQSYPQEFDLCIDLHRDAYVPGLLNVLQTDVGFNYAQTMVLIGRGDDFTPDKKPAYDVNLRFAQALTREMNEQIPNICRNVTVKSGRYNQHIGKTAVLIEVGHNHNTLDEALATIPCLADAIHKTLN